MRLLQNILGEETEIESCHFMQQNQRIQYVQRTKTIAGRCKPGTTKCPTNTTMKHEHAATHFTITENAITCFDFKCGPENKKKYPQTATNDELDTMFGVMGRASGCIKAIQEVSSVQLNILLKPLKMISRFLGLERFIFGTMRHAYGFIMMTTF